MYYFLFFLLSVLQSFLTSLVDKSSPGYRYHTMLSLGKGFISMSPRNDDEQKSLYFVIDVNDRIGYQADSQVDIIDTGRLPGSHSCPI